MALLHCVKYRQVKALLGACSLLGMASALPANPPEEAPAGVDNRGVLAEIAVDEHNRERLSLKLKPLTWSPQLAEDAARWAKKLAAENRFEHALEELAEKKQGENLWMGTAGEYRYQDMIALWLDEREMAKSGRFPDVSKTGNWEDVGHYSQIVWPGTKELGCALASNADDEFLVCRYAPAGNVIGQMVSVDSRK